MEFTVFYKDSRAPFELKQYEVNTIDAHEAARLFADITRDDPGIKIFTITPDPREILDFHNCWAEADQNGKCRICGAVRPSAAKMRRAWYNYLALDNPIL